MVDLVSYFLFQPVLHDWCNKGRYPVCEMVQIKEPFLLTESPSSGGSGIPLSLSEWFFTIIMSDAI